MSAAQTDVGSGVVKLCQLSMAEGLAKPWHRDLEAPSELPESQTDATRRSLSQELINTEPQPPERAREMSLSERTARPKKQLTMSRGVGVGGLVWRS
ncbi:hypothetical protein SRHO_G00017700 [Serrasalmus rhombeus]